MGLLIMSYSIDIITWQNIELEIRYNPSYCAVLKGDDAMAHIEVSVLHPERHPLPITETGYKSHFIHCIVVEEYGTATDFVLAWLNHESRSPEWKKLQEAARQGELF